MSRVYDNKASNVQWNDHEPSLVEDQWQNIHSEGLTSSKDQSYNTEIELRETKSQTRLVEGEDDIPKWTTTFFGTNFRRFSEEWNQIKSRWQLKYGQTSSVYEPTIATKSRTNGDWALPVDETNGRTLLPYYEYKSGFFNSIENSRSSESEWHDQDEKMKQFKRKRCLCISVITVVTCLVLAACITSAMLIHVILAPTDKNVYVESRISATTTNQQYLEGMGDKSTKIFKDFEEQFCSAVQEKLKQTSKCKVESLRNGSVIVMFFIYIQTENIKSDVKASIMSILSVKENEKSQLKFGTFVINSASFKAIETQTIVERSVPDDTINWSADDNKETVKTKASSSSDISTTDKSTSSTVQPENTVTSLVIPTSFFADKIESSTSSIIIHSKTSSTTQVVFVTQMPTTNEYAHTISLKSSENTVELDSPAFEILSTIDVPNLTSITEYLSKQLYESSSHHFISNTGYTDITMSHIKDESTTKPQATVTSTYTKSTADITFSTEINTMDYSFTMMEIVSTNEQMYVTSDQLVDSSDFQRMSTANVPDLTSTTEYPSAPLSENSAHGSTANTVSTKKEISMSHLMDESKATPQITSTWIYTKSTADITSSNEINTIDFSSTMMGIVSTNGQMYVTSDQLVDSSDFQRTSTADVPDLTSTTEYPSAPLSENTPHGSTVNTVSTQTEISMSHLIDESKATPQTTSTWIYTKSTADITSSNEINTIDFSSTMMEIVSTNGQMYVTSDQLVDSSNFQRMSTVDVPDLTSTTDYPSAPLSENSAHGSTSNTDSTEITMSHLIGESEKNTLATIVSTYTTSIADSASSTDFSRNDHSLTATDIFSTNVQMYVTSDLMEAQSSLTADMMYDTLSSVSHMYITDSDKRSVILSLSSTPSISDGYGSSELFEDSLYSISTSYISPTDLVGSNSFEATDSSLETPSLDFAGSVTSNPLDYVSSTIEVSSITPSSSSSMEVSTTLPIPKPVVEATGVTVYQDDGNLTFTCTVDNYQNFTNIILSYDNLEIFNITANHDDTEESTWSLAKTALETTLTLVVTSKNPTCEDTNKYFRCLVHGAWGVVSDSAVSVVKVKPGIPKIALPIKFIENQDTLQDIYCSVDAGDPAAIVSWSVEFIDGQKTDPYDFSATITTNPDQPCSNITKSSIRRTFDLSWHNASLCCTATQDQITSSTCQKLYIIPADYCIGKEDGIYDHPYDDCYLYVQCGSNRTHVNTCGEGSNNCFDESSGTCSNTITTTRDPTTRDPNFVDDPYSCEGKPNDAYIPVQNSCKNYTRCVNNIKYLGVCQGNTFFIGVPKNEFTCNFGEENAYCNRNT